MVLYRITLVPLGGELQKAYPGLLTSFYTDDAAFDGSLRLSDQLLKMLLERGPDRGYFQDPDKSIFISESTYQEEVAKQ